MITGYLLLVYLFAPKHHPLRQGLTLQLSWKKPSPLQPKPGPQAQYPQTKTTTFTTWSAHHPSVLAQQQYAAQKRLAGASNTSGKSSARSKAPARHKTVLAELCA